MIYRATGAKLMIGVFGKGDDIAHNCCAIVTLIMEEVCVT